MGCIDVCCISPGKILFYNPQTITGIQCMFQPNVSKVLLHSSYLFSILYECSSPRPSTLFHTACVAKTCLFILYVKSFFSDIFSLYDCVSLYQRLGSNLWRSSHFSLDSPGIAAVGHCSGNIQSLCVLLHIYGSSVHSFVGWSLYSLKHISVRISQVPLSLATVRIHCGLCTIAS